MFNRFIQTQFSKKKISASTLKLITDCFPENPAHDFVNMIQFCKTDTFQLHF